jgi:hypothetical protein
MTEPLPNYANDEIVTIAWIASIPGFSPDMVATQLPPSANKDGTPAGWVVAGKGFVTVAVAGGTPDPLLPVKRVVMQVDCWATRPGSNKPPWNVANALAMAIQFATWDRVTMSRRLTLGVRGQPYPMASVQGAAMMTAPRRILDDAGDFARYSFDLGLQWITLADILL